MIRDLVELARNIVQEEQREINKAKAQELAEERLLDMLLPHPPGFGAMDERANPRTRSARKATSVRGKNFAPCCSRANSTIGKWNWKWRTKAPKFTSWAGTTWSKWAST